MGRGHGVVGAWAGWRRRVAHSGAEASTARAACLGLVKQLSGTTDRLRMARAEARRMAAHNLWRRSAKMAEGSAPEVECVAAARAKAFRVQVPDGPQPPDGSAIIGIKDKPWEAHSAAVFK